MSRLDEELVRDYINGDEESFRLLIHKYTPIIYNFLYNLVGKSNVEDITQEVFIKVWKNIKRFDDNNSKFKTWIFIIARRSGIDYLRKNKDILFSELDTSDELFEDNLIDKNLSDIESYINKISDTSQVNEFLQKLPEHYKSTLMMHYQEDMTFKEISNIFNKPLNTIKSWHFRALEKLKSFIENAPKP